MNKSELIDAIASGANLSKADAARALNATTSASLQQWLVVMECNLLDSVAS